MGEFAFVYRGRDTSGSPEQMQKHMEKWLTWFNELRANGHISESGHPLDSAGMVVQGKKKAVTDGPYAEAKDVIGGFTLVEAKDLRQAAELAKGCPILEVGGSVEVRPLQKLNM